MIIVGNTVFFLFAVIQYIFLRKLYGEIKQKIQRQHSVTTKIQPRQSVSTKIQSQQSVSTKNQTQQCVPTKNQTQQSVSACAGLNSPTDSLLWICSKCES